MKIFKSVLLISALALTFISCSKDNDEFKGLAGTWEGVWGFDADTPTIYERWQLEADGDIKVYDDDGDMIGEGSFDVDGLNFTMEMTPPGEDYSYKYAGLYHDALGEILGTWGKAPSATNRGTFEMYKQ